MSNPDTTKVGGRIRSIRTDKGLSQEQLAARLNVPQSQVSRWESSDRIDADLRRLAQIADALEVRFADLVPECGGAAA